MMPFASVRNGNFNFTGTETGNDYADYLLGAVVPGNFFEASSEIEDPRSQYVGLYAQDSFKFRPNLTLNYGLRYRISTPWADKLGRVTTFVPGLQSKVIPDSPTGWVFPGDPGIPAGLSKTQYDNFDPRLGLAYSPGFSGIGEKIFGGPGKSSIRVSFGMYHSIFEEGSYQWATGDDPWSIWDTLPVSVYFESPFQNRTTGAEPINPFPFVLPKKFDPSFSMLKFMPEGNLTAIKTDNVMPYSEQS